MRLKKTIGDIGRFREILGVFFEEGFDILINELRLRFLVPWRCRIRCIFKKCKTRCVRTVRPIEIEESFPKRLRLTFERLGPTFVKFGQILSLRPDIIPSGYAKELEKLQSEVTPFPYSEAKKIIEADLGKSLKQLFKSFEKKPVAAASLAQVHRAFLRDGAEVAVKVQRPEIREVILKDIHIMLFLAGLLEKYVETLKRYQPVRLVKEFADWTIRELDFTVEGKNADHFRFNFREEPGINIPKIYWDYSAKKVLTMDFVHGIKADDIKGMKRAEIDPKALALNGVRAIFKQFFIDGFFHADPHPGNFFALRNNILCLHDFGIVGYLDAETRNKITNCFISFINKDADNYLKYFLDLTETNEKSDIKSFKRAITDILNDFFYSPVKEQSIALAFYRILNLGIKHGVSFPTDLSLFCKALLTTEAMGLKIYPEFDFNKELEPFMRMVWQAKLEPKKLVKAAQITTLDYLSFLKSLPEQTKKLLKKIEKGEIGVRINTEELREFKEEMDRQNDIRVLSMVIVAAVLSSALILRLEEKIVIWGLSLGQIGLIISGILIIWLLVLVRRK